MSKSPCHTAQDTPATSRFYVLLNGPQSVVVKGWHLADPLAKQLGVTAMKASSLERAHEILRETYGYVPQSALHVSRPGTSAPPPPPAPPAGVQATEAEVVRRPLPWLRIETEDGDVLNKTVIDPDQIEGLKALRLWP